MAKFKFSTRVIKIESNLLSSIEDDLNDENAVHEIFSYMDFISSSEAFDLTQFENFLGIMKIEIGFKRKHSLLFSTKFLFYLLKLPEKSACKLYTENILDLALRISSQIDKSSIESDYSIPRVFEKLANVKSNDEFKKDQIKEKLLELVLNIFKEFTIINEALINNEVFLKLLQLISTELHNSRADIPKRFNFCLFVKYESFGFLTKLFDFLLKRIEIASRINIDGDDLVSDECNENILKFLLEIIIRLVRQQLKYEDYFLKENILQVFIDFFQIPTIVHIFYKRYINMLDKLTCIFMDLTRTLYYNRMNCKKFEYFANKSDSFAILRRVKSVYAEMFTKEKPFSRCFLKSLGYLQETFQPSESFLSIQDYEFIAKTGFGSNYFKNVSNEFKSLSEVVELEFVNDENQIETQYVTRMKTYFDLIIYEPSYYFVNLIRQLSIIFSSDETKLIAYRAYKYFFKSILMYGLDIEKMLCLSCLVNFIHISEIHCDLFGDVNLIGYLGVLKNGTELSNTSTDSIKKRLRKHLEGFLRFKF